MKDLNMQRKLYLVLPVFGLVLMTTAQTYSQAPQSPERFKIYIVDKLDIPRTVDSGPLATPGENKDCLLLDTQTGKTWLLTVFRIPFDKKPGEADQGSMQHYQWTPIFFDDDVLVGNKSLLPPKANK